MYSSTLKVLRPITDFNNKLQCFDQSDCFTTSFINRFHHIPYMNHEHEIHLLLVQLLQQYGGILVSLSSLSLLSMNDHLHTLLTLLQQLLYTTQSRCTCMCGSRERKREGREAGERKEEREWERGGSRRRREVGEGTLSECIDEL